MEDDQALDFESVPPNSRITAPAFGISVRDLIDNDIDEAEQQIIDKYRVDLERERN